MSLKSPLGDLDVFFVFLLGFSKTFYGLVFAFVILIWLWVKT